MSRLGHSPVCVVGKYRFRLSSESESLLEQTVESFRADADQLTPCDIIDLDSPNNYLDQPQWTRDPASTIKRVISVAEDAHHEHLFFDACCLVTPEGQSVFLAGQSFAGKSTLASAAILTLHWKILSEDIVFLDHATDQVVPLVCPISLRQSAPDLIEEATGQRVECLRHGRWLVCYDRFETSPIRARFPLAICLDGRAGQGALTVERHRSNDFVRKLITYGNWLTRPGAPEYVQQCFSSSQCWTVSGGTLFQRLEWLRNVSRTCVQERSASFDVEHSQ